ncbi:MAG: glycosyltransferase family 2 protein [Acidobacteriaceae bacterium]|nr:glycosyltransferase family 2 protein [Acidobacteriaceae bacterium]
MTVQDVYGIVIAYHPDESVIENLAALKPQVAQIVVVDNGSNEQELALLRAHAPGNFELIENGANLGIATALNVGLRFAAGHEYSLLFDQDSTVTPGFVETMVNSFAGSAYGERLALMVPRYVDKRDGAILPPFVGEDGTLNGAMTSGTLLRTALTDRVGWFADEYFIDAVDYEYSLRVRSAGMVILECPEAVLMHAPGTPTLHKHIFKQGHFQAANYSPVRRYYQERNKILMLKRHWRNHLKFCLGQIYLSLKELVKIVVYEPHEGKLKKLRYFARGWMDGLSGRSGPYPAVK